jgi:4-hydroxy-tetrahydrodipicolinate synthase
MTTSGLITALTTPFDLAHTIDHGALSAHLQFLWQAGCRHLLVSGTTGEFFSLEPEERIQLLKTARRSFNGTIMFQAGADVLSITLRLTRAASVEGADSVLCLPPWYLTGAPVEGVIRYFETVSLACPVPFLMYHFPRHTRFSLTPQMLARIPHAGIKDSAADVSLIAHTPRYFIGSDSQALAAHQLGGAGFVSARSNCEPELYAELDAAMRADDMDLAESLHRRVLEVTQSLNGPGQIFAVKQRIAAFLPGYPARVRLPLIAPSH